MTRTDEPIIFITIALMINACTFCKQSCIIYTPLSEGYSNIIGNTGVGTIHISTAWNVLTVYQIDKESRSTTEQVVHTPGHSPLSFT